MIDNKKLANLIYPNAKPIQFYLEKYKRRELKEGALVTRFAPSPTGYVHIGNFMQAVLDNHLAKQSGGVFYIRIEDTDDTRKIDEAVPVLIKTLYKYNIIPDEGYINVDTQKGNYGPYVQSQRKEIYESFAKYLIENGHAYPCFCTKLEEEKIRSEQGEKAETGYYGNYRRCNNLSIEEVENNLKQNKPFTVRFRNKSTDLSDKISAVDVIRGEITMQRWFKDDVLIKSDGIPVYAFAHVVDDFLMGTNLVVRGSEWLSTYALHIDLWKAFGFKIPKYLHTLMIFKKEENRKVKISKRYHPEAKMNYYEEMGYPTTSVLEYIYTLLNSNFEDWRRQNPTAELLSFPMSISKMNPSEALFDNDKLNNISKSVISRYTNKEMYEKTLEHAKAFNKNFAKILEADKQKWLEILNIDRETQNPRKDIACFSQVPDYFNYFISDPSKIENYKELTKDDISAVAENYLVVYKESDDQTTWWEKLKQTAEKLNYALDNKEYKQNPEIYKGNVSTFAGVIRLIVTGKENTPDLYQIMKILGQQEVENRIKQNI